MDMFKAALLFKTAFFENKGLQKLFFSSFKINRTVWIAIPNIGIGSSFRKTCLENNGLYNALNGFDKTVEFSRLGLSIYETVSFWKL